MEYQHVLDHPPPQAVAAALTPLHPPPAGTPAEEMNAGIPAFTGKTTTTVKGSEFLSPVVATAHTRTTSAVAEDIAMPAPKNAKPPRTPNLVLTTVHPNQII